MKRKQEEQDYTQDHHLPKKHKPYCQVGAGPEEGATKDPWPTAFACDQDSSIFQWPEHNAVCISEEEDRSVGLSVVGPGKQKPGPNN